MNARERVLTTLRHGVPDQVPIDFSMTPPFLDMVVEKLDGKDPWDYFEVDVRSVEVESTEKETDFRVYFNDLPDNAMIGEWGLAEVPRQYVHYTEYRHPMAGFDSLQDLEAYPFPDLDADYRYVGLGEKVAELHDKGWAVKGGVAPQIFETSWQMRGLEQMMVDMAVDHDFAEALLDRVTEIFVVAARNVARAGIDVLITGDDVGNQDRMMMSPAMWRRWLKPRLAKVIAAAKEVNPAIIAFYHSDGFIEPIIPELIEIGVEVLNPIQPECMDPAHIRTLYGDTLAQWGTVGTQTTFPFGSPKEMRANVRERISTVGPDGLVLAPTHALQPDVPYENLVAFVEAAREYRI